ncbi:MAG: hypothetical protein KA004_15020 [Verrucomicrobiales bacterium]|nr:hypothetical protein [Verrucomicrobiales bacterium]
MRLSEMRLFLFCLLCVPVWGGGEDRDWMSTDGRMVRASLLGVEGARVTLRTPDGRRMVVRLDRLADADRAMVEAWRRGRSAELALPPLDVPPQSTVEKPRVNGPRRTGEEWEFSTRHFLFQSRAELSASAVQELATVAEATWEWSRNWPMPVPESGNAAGLCRVLLFQNKADYEAAGGPKDSAGFFRMDPLGGSRGALLTPVGSLGLEEQARGQVGKGWGYDPRVLIHEISHQLTAEYLNLLPLWIREGVAEWTSLPLYRGGTFLLGRDHLTARLRTRWEDFLRRNPETGEVLDDGKSAPAAAWTMPLQDLWGNAEHAETLRSGSLSQKQRLYFNALLCIHYFLQLEGDGQARRFRVYWQAVEQARLHFHSNGREGAVPQGTLRAWDSARRSLFPLLTAGKSPADWQRDMVRKYAAVGIRLEYAEGAR